MKKLYSLFYVAVLGFCSVTAQAQTPEEEKAWNEYMTPGDNHAHMADETGSWTAKMTMWMAPGEEPQTYNADVDIRMIMGGRYQESKYKGTIMGMPFEGKNTIAYNNASKIYTSTWIDNMSTGMMVSEGKLDVQNKKLVFEGKSVNPMDGKTFTTREVYTIVDENTRKMEMFDKIDGKEHKSMEIILTRKK